MECKTISTTPQWHDHLFCHQEKPRRGRGEQCVPFKTVFEQWTLDLVRFWGQVIWLNFRDSQVGLLVYFQNHMMRLQMHLPFCRICSTPHETAAHISSSHMSKFPKITFRFIFTRLPHLQNNQRLLEKASPKQFCKFKKFPTDSVVHAPPITKPECK